MVPQCPHCQKDLQFNDAQQEKLAVALASLKKGTLKLGCPLCKKAIKINKDGTIATEQSNDSMHGDGVPKPPAYPDISWLATGIYDAKEVVEDVPKVMILMKVGDGRDHVHKAFVELGYQVEFPESSEDAISQMRFVTFKAVVLGSEFDGELTASPLHRFMVAMPMEKRRHIFYLLVGKEFHTLYDLEALANSANAVVNEKEAPHIDTILKKVFKEYDDLFGAYNEIIGKK